MQKLPLLKFRGCVERVRFALACSYCYTCRCELTRPIGALSRLSMYWLLFNCLDEGFQSVRTIDVINLVARMNNYVENCVLQVNGLSLSNASMLTWII